LKQRFAMTAITLSLAFFGYLPSAFADQAPVCYARQQVVSVNNAQVANWKTSTPDQFRSRAHVTGTVSKLYSNQTGHSHFELTLSGTTTTLEIIYNQDFGASAPTIQIGDQVESCGDYISAPHGGTHASPDDAILHWVHKSPDLNRHDDGYLLINGTLFGMDAANAGSRD